MSSTTSTSNVPVTAVEATYEAGDDFAHEIASSKQWGTPEEITLPRLDRPQGSQAVSVSLPATVKVSIGQNKSLMPIANVIT